MSRSPLPSRRAWPSMTLLAVLALGAAAGLEAADVTFLVPGMANASGLNGTHFASDLSIRNEGSGTATVTFELLPPLGGTAPAPSTRSVGPGETLTIPNVLATLFGLSETFGALRVRTDQPLLLSGRTYNDANAAGTYGLAVEPVLEGDLLTAGRTAHTPWVSYASDGSTGYRTNVAVVLGRSGSQAEVVVYDAAGAEAGRRTFEGGPGVVQVPAGDIAGRDVPVGRAEFRVLSGTATGYVSVVENTTGDGIAVFPFARPDGPTDVFLSGVARTAGAFGSYFRTDVRLFNASDTDATVTVTPLSLPVTAKGAITIPAKGTREIVDVLGTVVAAPDGSAGALRLESDAGILVLGRTSNVKLDGSPGAFGAYQKPVDASRLLPAGGTARLIGLTHTTAKPGTRCNVAFLSGPDGATVRLVLRSRAGDVLATRDAAVSIGATTWLQKPLGDLFDGLSPLDGVTLEVQPTAGSVFAYAAVVDNGTGDGTVIEARPSPTFAQLCPAPGILDFSVFPDAAAAGEERTLSWSVVGADRVSIAPGLGEQPASGSLVVTPSQSTTYVLEAVSSCGNATATANAPVGPASVSSVSPAAAAPGQLVTVRSGSLPSSSTPSYVVFVFGDVAEVRARVERVTATGDFQALVPFLPSPDEPNGYWSGPVTVALEVDGELTGTVPFTIATLAPPADPSAVLRDFVDRTAAEALSRIEALKGAGSNGEALQPLVDAVNAEAARLRKLADDVAAVAGSGGAVAFAVDQPSAAQPNPPTTPITKADLAVVAALLQNLAASSAALGPPVASRQPEAAASIPCVKDEIAMRVCIGYNIIDPGSLFGNVLDGIVPVSKLRNCLVSVAEISLAAVAASYEKFLATPRILCDALPIYLKGFNAQPSPDPVPVDKVSAVKITMDLYALKKKDEIVAAVVSEVAGKVVEKFRKLPKECGALFADAVSKVADLLRKSLTGAADLVIGTFNLPNVTSRAVQLSKCDLIEVKPGNQKILRESEKDQSRHGDPLYYFEGRTPGGETNLYLLPSAASFARPDKKVIPFQKYPVPIDVGKVIPVYGSSSFSATFPYNDSVLKSGTLIDGMRIRAERPLRAKHTFFGVSMQAFLQKTGDRSYRAMTRFTGKPICAIPLFPKPLDTQVSLQSGVGFLANEPNQKVKPGWRLKGNLVSQARENFATGAFVSLTPCDDSSKAVSKLDKSEARVTTDKACAPITTPVVYFGSVFLSGSGQREDLGGQTCRNGSYDANGTLELTIDEDP